MNLKMPLLQPYTITLRFKEKYDSWISNLLKHTDHDGIDLAAPAGTKVYSSNVDGEWVLRVGMDGDGTQYVMSYVLTQNKNVFFLLYRHLQKVKVSVGQFVLNAEIGEIGQGQFNPHLHFGVFSACDPGNYLNK